MRVSAQITLTPAQAYIDDVRRMAAYVVEQTQKWVVGEWAEVAKHVLTTSYIQYIDGLAQDGSLEPLSVAPEGYTAAVVLVGSFPNMLESGSPAFDIKPGLLRSPKAKRDRKGRPYIIVPFRSRPTAGSTGVAVGGGALPSGFPQLAQQLAFQGPGKPTQAQITAKSKFDVMAAAHPGAIKPQVGGMTGPYRWGSSPFAGMVKGGSKGHEQYMTFRAVSANSNPSSWWHPGLKGVDVAPQVAPRAQAAMEQLFNEQAQALLKA